jgi:colicin import membrane protein
MKIFVDANKRAWFFSLSLHGMLIAWLLFSVNFSKSIDISLPANPAPVISARAVDAAVVEQQVANIQREREQKRQAALARKRQQALAQQRAAEKKRREAEAAARKEKARLAKLRAQQQAKREQAAAEQRRLAEQAEREAAEKKRQQLAREQQLAAELAAEQASLAAAKQKQVDSIVAHYASLIRDAVQNVWYRPEDDAQKKTVVLVQLAPSGMVVNVSIEQPSGNSALDRSIVSAIYQASPLPVPQQTDIFERYFRRFTFSTAQLSMP